MSAPVCPHCRGPMTGPGEYCPRCAGRLLLETEVIDADAEDSPARPAGLRVGEYELGPELGRGAMGVVYRARQPRLKRDVAVKVILASRFAGDSARKRFLAEAELAAHLDHPNIVPIYEVGETPDGPFYVMKLVEGRTLAASIARAVHHAHQRGVLHRDLKPGNILLDAQGEPHITDFGLAKRFVVPALAGSDAAEPAKAGTTNTTNDTLSGAILGTPAYMSPEQARGEKGITTATDIWSLGAMLYHLLAGRPPFAGDSAMEVLRKVMEEEPVPPGRFTNDDLRFTSGQNRTRVNRKSYIVNPDLSTICLKCLEKDPARRYASALALAEDLERWLKHEPIRARPVSSGERIVKWARRNPARATLATALLVMSLVAITGITWQWRRANKHAAAVDSALIQTRDALWQANFDRAHALRTSRRMGQRVEALKAVRAAAAIRPTPELREEAIAAMALTDLEDVGAWQPYPTNAANWAPDSRLERFVFSRPDGGIEVRRFQDGQLLATLTNGPRRMSFRFEGDSDLLLTQDMERYRVWNVRTAELVFEMSVLYEPSVNEIKAHLSPDGRWLAYPVSKSSVAWRELKGEGEAGRLNGFESVGRVAFSATAELLAVHSANELQVWRLSDRKRLGALTLPKGSLQFKWHRSEPFLVTGCEDRSAYVWDVLSGGVQTLPGHRREGVFAYFHPDERLLASTSFDLVLSLWDPFARLQLLETTFANPHRFSADGQWLAVKNARGLGKLKVHLPQECRLFHPRLGLKPGGARFSRDDRFLVGTRVDDSWMCIWDVESGQRLAEIALDEVKTAQFYGERQLVTASREGVLLWTNLHSADGWEPSRVRVVIPRPRGYAGFVMSTDGARLLLDRSDGGDVFEFSSGRLLFRLRGQAMFTNPAFSVDGQWIASGYWDNRGKRRSEFWIWSATDGQPVRKIPMGNCAAHFSPDGRWLLAASEDEYLQFAITGPPTNWPMVRRFTRETSGFLHGPAAFSGDGTLLALMTDNTVVRLVEAATGRELARFTPLPDVIGMNSLSFSHNGRWLVAGTEFGPHVWDLALIRARLREMNLDWDGPPNLPTPKERSAAVAKPSRSGNDTPATP